MKKKNKNLWKKAAGLGAVAGMRTTVALAIASHYLSERHPSALAKSKLGFMQTSKASLITKFLTAAELAADKNPHGPNRISLPQLLARVATGGLVGSLLYQAAKEDIGQGILLGGTAALASTYASFYLRQYIDKIPYVKDPLVGALEDAVAVSCGRALMKQ